MQVPLRTFQAFDNVGVRLMNVCFCHAPFNILSGGICKLAPDHASFDLSLIGIYSHLHKAADPTPLDTIPWDTSVADFAAITGATPPIATRSHPGRWRGPLSGVDLPPERWPQSAARDP
jgi:hypothetical protein